MNNVNGKKLATKMAKVTSLISRLEAWPPICMGYASQPKLPEALKRKPESK